MWPLTVIVLASGCNCNTVTKTDSYTGRQKYTINREKHKSLTAIAITDSYACDRIDINMSLMVMAVITHSYTGERTDKNVSH